MRTFSLLVGSALFVTLSISGCSGTAFRTNSDDDAAVGSDSSKQPSPDARPGRCSSAQQCPAGNVCDPKTNACVGKLACTTHADCGKAAYCDDASKTCAVAKTGTPCATSDNCGTGETCMSGFCGCKGQNYTAQTVTPNVLIVLDRSLSMEEQITGGSKWTIAKKGITDLLASTGANIRFGLAAFPGTTQKCDAGGAPDCTAGAVFVDPADNNATAINNWLAGATTCAPDTPTAETLTALLSYKGLKDATRPNYILLVTDGGANCNDPIAVVTQLRKQNPEIKTYAIGFGSGVDPMQLNGIAQAGGTALTGSTSYYVASDPASLAKAFAAIAGSAMSCTYKLSDVPKDLKQLYVYEGKQPNLKQIPQDTTHADGWDYDAVNNQLVFYGPACQNLQSGTVTDLVIVYGCPLTVQ